MESPLRVKKQKDPVFKRVRTLVCEIEGPQCAEALPVHQGRMLGTIAEPLWALTGRSWYLRDVEFLFLQPWIQASCPRIQRSPR